MKKEITYGAVIYSTRHNQVEFLTEGNWNGVQSLPGMRAETEEELIRAIREKTGLEVRLDIVFRHEIWEGTDDDVARGTCFIAAEALNENEELNEEGSGWRWGIFADQLESIQMDEEEREALMHAAVYLSRKHFPYNHHEFGFPVYGRLWYRENAVDIHSHILAGVDDGAQSIEEAWNCLNWTGRKASGGFSLHRIMEKRMFARRIRKSSGTNTISWPSLLIWACQA